MKNQVENDTRMKVALEASAHLKGPGYFAEALASITILPCSLAIARAGARVKNMTLYRHVAELACRPTETFVLPVPSPSVFLGGTHVTNGLLVQEIIIMPVGSTSFWDALQISMAVIDNLLDIRQKECGQKKRKMNCGDACPSTLVDCSEAFELVKDAIEQSPHAKKIKIATSVAAHDFCDRDTGSYDMQWKDEKKMGSERVRTEDLAKVFERWTDEYSLASIEEPFDKEDWDGHRRLTASIGGKVQVVGGALFGADLFGAVRPCCCPKAGGDADGFMGTAPVGGRGKP